MKKMFIGVFIGAMLMIPLSAHGEVINLVNQVVQGMFPVTVDGKSVGNAIIVDNTTYLPVRDFGEATGYTVTFTDAREVVMTKNTAFPTPSPSTTPTPQPTPPTMTKEQKIDQINSKISENNINIQALKIAIIGDEKDGRLDNIEMFKKRLADKEKELADLQAQLNTLQSQP